MVLTELQITSFRTLFKTEVRNYWHPLLGFDILKLEADLHLESDSQSMAQVLEGRYGTDATNLIRELLAIR